ncbi:hypothetical protein [Streptomyces syringium]|uniref:hypothetical protein n=1 Tax=Streptomyces syringium TaxID=76729 RepID=UPI003454D93B
MSYDLAVWEGDHPADDAAAARRFMELYSSCVDADVTHPPTARIAQYVTTLLERWPDLTEDEDDISPWSTGPLILEARGPMIYFPLRYSMAEEASAHAAAVATAMGLVCYDPQTQQVRK